MSELDNISLDFGDGYTPIALGGTQPAEGLFGVRASIPFGIGKDDNGKIFLTYGWQISTDVGNTGSVGKGRGDAERAERQYLPHAGQEEKARKATFEFFVRFLQSWGIDVSKLKGGIALGLIRKSLEARRAAGHEAHIFFSPYIKDVQDSYENWLSAEEYNKGVAVPGTYKRPPAKTTPGYGAAAQGLGAQDLGAGTTNLGAGSAAVDQLLGDPTPTNGVSGAVVNNAAAVAAGGAADVGALL